MINENNQQNWLNRKAPTLSEHRFAIGQCVRMKNAPPMTSSSRGVSFRITALMPCIGDTPQYRIRNDLELHEHMVTQDNLEPVAIAEATQGNALVIKKTIYQR